MHRELFFVSLFSLPTLAVAQAAELSPPVRPDNSMIQTLLMLGLCMVFFYFILYRPEQKKRQVLEEAKSSLKKGDKVVAMGIIGTVYKIEKETVVLKMYDESKIEVLKAAISDVDIAKANA